MLIRLSKYLSWSILILIVSCNKTASENEFKSFFYPCKSQQYRFHVDNNPNEEYYLKQFCEEDLLIHQKLNTDLQIFSEATYGVVSNGVIVKSYEFILNGKKYPLRIEVPNYISFDQLKNGKVAHTLIQYKDFSDTLTSVKHSSMRSYIGDTLLQDKKGNKISTIIYQNLIEKEFLSDDYIRTVREIDKEYFAKGYGLVMYEENFITEAGGTKKWIRDDF